jgi:hypothetical protein
MTGMVVELMIKADSPMTTFGAEATLAEEEQR